MANIKSQIKRIRVTAKQTERNKAVKSLLKTRIIKFRAAVEGKDKKAAKVEFDLAVKALDSAASKGIVHLNNAANKKSALAKALNNVK